MNATHAPALVDNRALLHTVGHRKVKAVAGESTPYAAALYGVVLQRKRCWEHGEWEAVLEDLDSSELTIAEFLTAEHARPKT